MKEVRIYEIDRKRTCLVIICLLIAVIIVSPVMADLQGNYQVSTTAYNTSSATQISITAPQQSLQNSTIKKTAAADVIYSFYVGQNLPMWADETSNGVPVPGAVITFYRSDDGVTWCPIQTDTANSYGYAYLTGYTETCTGLVYYRAQAIDAAPSSPLSVQWLQTDPPMTCVPPVSCVSLVDAYVSPASPVNGQPYTIHLVVSSPGAAGSVTDSILSSESTDSPGWNDSEIIAPNPNPLSLPVSASPATDFSFMYQHLQHPFLPLEQVYSDQGGAGVGEDLLSSVPDDDNNDCNSLDQWLNTQGTAWFEAFNCRMRETFHYTFQSTQVNNLPTVTVAVGTPFYKVLGLDDAVFSYICASTYTTSAAIIPVLPIKVSLSVGKQLTW